MMDQVMIADEIVGHVVMDPLGDNGPGDQLMMYRVMINQLMMDLVMIHLMMMDLEMMDLVMMYMVVLD